MGKPAARLGDQVIHAPPGVLTGGPGSPNVFIEGRPAWRGIPSGSAGPLKQARSAAEREIQAAETATRLAPTPEARATAYGNEQATKGRWAAANSALVSTLAAGQADIHSCGMPLPVPPHGPGLVTDGSPTVLIDGAPAARQGDTVEEAVGPPNKIVGGSPTVIIGP